MKEFKDKVAVITGAASGIGLGIARRAAKEGMKVVLADIEAECLSQTEEELKSSGASVISVLTDVSKAEDVEALAQKTLDAFGEVHLLCNNAGVAAGGLLWETQITDWRWVIDVNLWGVIHGIRVFVPIMLKQGNECHIVNTASLEGLLTESPGNGIYTVTKHGVVALSEVLLRELQIVNSKINVSVLCPGFVSTKIADSERNRAPEMCGPDYEPTLDKFCRTHPELKQFTDMFINAIEQGLSPDKAGDIVFEALKNEFFYILTDASLIYKKILKKRMEGILEAFQQNKPIIKQIS